MYLAMSRLKIVCGKEVEFESTWKKRQQNIDSKIEEAQKLRDAGFKAHEDGKHAESEKLLSQALKLFKN